MDFLTLCKQRYSVRKYADRPIEEEKLKSILEAGRLAPTATNYQPQRIFVLKSEQALAKIRAVTPMAFNAPVVLLVCYDSTASWKAQRLFRDDFDAGETDADIAVTMMMMQAQDLGLGSLWVRGFHAQDVADAFALPDDLHVVCLLDLGYPAEDSVPADWHYTRFPTEHFVTEL